MLTEREERIVAWLRHNPYGLSKDPVRHRIADAIERGDHLAWKPSPTIPAEEWLKKPSCG